MDETLKALQDTPLPTILVFAGIVFLLVSVATIKKPIVVEITPHGRIVSGIIGGLIMIIGIILFIYSPADSLSLTPTPTTEPTPTITAVPTNPPSPIPTTIPPSATIKLEKLMLPIMSESDLPPLVLVPPKILTAGVVTNFDPADLAIRVFVCSESTNTCTSQELPYLDSSRWDTVIAIGEPADNCNYFLLKFGIIKFEENKKLNLSPGSAIPVEWLPDFIDVKNFEVKRALNRDNSVLQPPCP